MTINLMFLKRAVLPACILGGIITLLSGFLSNMPLHLLGVGYWGYPLPWIKQVVYPGAPKVIIWHFLILDWLMWTGLFLVVLHAINRLSKTEIGSPDNFVEENKRNSMDEKNKK